MSKRTAIISRGIGLVVLLCGLIAIGIYVHRASLHDVAPPSDPAMLEAVDKGNLAEVRRLVGRDPKNANAQYPEDPNVTLAPGGSVLLRALNRRNKPIALFLITHGADVNHSHHSSGPPLFAAVDWGDTDVTDRMLAKGADPDSKHNGGTPLGLAVSRDRVAVARLLRKHGAKSVSPIIEAAAFGDVEAVDLLLKSNPEQLDSRDENGLSLLHYAARHRRLSVVKLLVARGTKVNATDSAGYTPLIEAINNGDLDTVRFLVKSGADVNQAPPKSGPVLGFAVESGNLEIVRFLLRSGSRAQFGSSHDPILWVPCGREHYDGTPLARFLISKGANINSAGDRGETLLHSAAQGNDVSMIAFLISNGSRVNAKNADGDTPLDVAETFGHQEAAKLLRAHGGVRTKH